MRRNLALVTCIVAIMALLPPAIPAQADERCFSTGFCISGRIREFWEQNDGERVFGLPIGPLQDETVGAKTVKAQWFQRHRLELHADTPRPYDVQLGHLGTARLVQQGRPPADVPRSEPRADCRYFGETGHNVCGRWWEAYRASGVELDGQPGRTEAESLALFGLPLGEAQTETVGGVSREVQWFERARFERHPGETPPFDIQFGLLGNEIKASTPPPPAAATPVAPPVQPPVAPSPTPAPPVAPQPPRPAASAYDGAWYGVLSRGTELSFTVTGGAVTYLEVDIKPHSDCHVVTKIDYLAPGMTPPVIQNGKLSIVIEEPKISIWLDGTFGPVDKVRGEGRFVSVDSGCASADRFDWQASKAPTEPLVEGIDGQWSGLTAKGEEVTFTVAGRVITRMEITFQKKDECTVVVTTPQPLTVNSFVLNFDSPVGPGYINGRFTTSNAVDGFLQLVPLVKGCGSNVGEWRWNARRQT